MSTGVRTRSPESEAEVPPTRLSPLRQLSSKFLFITKSRSFIIIISPLQPTAGLRLLHHAISVYCWLAASSSSLLRLRYHPSIELVFGRCFCVQRAVAKPESLGSTAHPPYDICGPPSSISGPLLFERYHEL
ncbi:jg26975 [Pararge aegeria aegeria]|uniref:Jg26975 protein n=1 Tax=Pararge aegeria aegeria TaxID=348720 RepID=A0A8S4RTE3_9NEOP|nr:jg26975 [Pararge aegeria aegeria]